MIGGTAIGRGQWLHYPTEGVPRHADSTANLSAPPPRLPDGKPDFSGIWHVALRNPCNEQTTFIPCNSEIGGSPLAIDLGAQLPGGLPYQPWAVALVKEREANGHWDDPHVRCLPDNPPRTWGMPHLTKIVHTPKLLVMLYEVNAMYRQIFTDGRPLPEDPTPGWNGYSTAHWEGDTLVVTTDRIDWKYIDPSGIPQGPSSSIVERITPTPDGTRLSYTMTITDPATFTAPVELKRAWVWRPDETVKPYNCVERKGRS